MLFRSATLLAQAIASDNSSADLAGTGQIGSTDTEILDANYGFAAALAPQAIAQTGPVISTHTNLAGSVSLASLAQDNEGNPIFWTILGATNGTASISADGQNLIFNPAPGYSGPATVTLQADDGFAASAPIIVNVNVSGAALEAIHITRVPTMTLGSAEALQVTGDFADQTGVVLTGNYLSFLSSDSDVVSADTNGILRANNGGIATITVSADGLTAENVITAGISPTTPQADASGNELNVYPLSIDLPAGVGQRQIDVHALTSDGSLGTTLNTAASGTVYYISDPSVASISPDGLITAKAGGLATITVVNGGLQATLTLEVQAAVVGPTTATAANGAVTQDTSGDTLMIGAGSVSADTTASISSLSLSQLDMPLPAPTLLNALGAVTINLSGATSSLPLQLALRVNSPTPLAAGTQVMFWQEGTITDANGVSHQTWWLVDNGVIGSDGLAHTASQPYVGITTGGNILVTTASTPNPNTGAQTISGSLLNFNALWSQQGSIAIAPSASMAIAAMGIFGGMSDVTGVTYTIEGSYQLQIPQGALLPNSTVSIPEPPNLPVTTPAITGVQYNPTTRQLTITGDNFIPPGQSPNNFQVQVWLVPTGDQLAAPSAAGTPPVNGLVWEPFNATLQPDGSLTITLPAGIALSQHDIYVERTALTSTATGAMADTMPIDSDPVMADSAPPSTDTLVTTANAIEVFQPGSNLQPLLLKTVTVDNQGNPLKFAGSYTQQIVFSDDGTLAYIAGSNDKIYVFDTETQDIVATYTVQGSDAPISALAFNDGWLYVAEGNNYGGGGELVRVNVDETSPDFLNSQQTLDIPGVVAPYGFEGIAINGGRYLAVTAPAGQIPVTNGPVPAPGNVYVIDLDGVGTADNIDSSNVAMLNLADYPNSYLGKGPLYITSGNQTGQFLVSNSKDFDSGLAGITFGTYASDGTLTGSSSLVDTQLTPAASNPNWLQAPDQQNIQSAAGTVIFNYQGQTYALVADQNYLFNDPHYTDDDNYGLGEQIGGKIGVIEDPFGTNGGPIYLGATTPIPGVALNQLTLDQNGMLYAVGFVDDTSGHYSPDEMMYDSMFVWNAGQVIQAALNAQAAGQPLTTPIDRTSPLGAQIPAATPARYDGTGLTAAQLFGSIYGVGTYQTQEGIPTVALQDLPYLQQLDPGIVANAQASAAAANAASMPAKDTSNGTIGTALIRTGAEVSYLLSGLSASVRSLFGYDNSAQTAAMAQAQQVLNTVDYDLSGINVGADILKAVDGFITSAVQVPLEAADVTFTALGAAKSVITQSTPPDLPVLSQLGQSAANGASAGELAKQIALQVAYVNPYFSGAATLYTVGQAVMTGDYTAAVNDAIQALALIAAPTVAGKANYATARQVALKTKAAAMKVQSLLQGRVKESVGSEVVKGPASEEFVQQDQPAADALSPQEEVQPKINPFTECFVAGTLVVTEQGLKPIEAIQVGDMVAARNEHTRDDGWRQVKQLFVTEERTIYRIVLRGTSGDTELGVTKEHPFYVKDEWWRAASDLRVGDKVELRDRGFAEVIGTSIDAEPARTYNFEVTELHTYFVGSLGVWVHNACLLGTIAKAVIGNLKLAKLVPGQSVSLLKAPKDFRWNSEVYQSVGSLRGEVGALGEAIAIRVMKEATGLNFEPLQNSRNQGIDLIAIDKGPPPAIYIVEVKTAGEAAKAQNPSAVSLTDKALGWLDDAQEGLIAGLEMDKDQIKQFSSINKLIVKTDGGASSLVRPLLLQIKVPIPEEIGPNAPAGEGTAEGPITISLTSKQIPTSGGQEQQDVTAEGPNQAVVSLTQSDADSLLAAASQYWLNAGAPAALLNSLTVGIGDLPAGVAAETVGSQITLSMDGAGWGWFVDPNPTSEADFSTTSQPNEFAATTGSPAAGKLDLLTVLIHEMGHVLGLSDVSDSDDNMEQYLAPGMRVLPSADDIAQMLATVSQDLDTTGSVTSGIAQTIVNPPPTVVQSGSYVVGQVQTTLSDGSFATGLSDWTTSGTVTTDGSGNAILTNSTAADAQLAQTFNIDSSDQYLQFTVTDGMQANNGTTGPQDAFDVALDNASTGTSLVGTDGLSDSDGLLNIQANGTETDGSMVSKTVNADGSTTYLINLQGAFASGAVTAGAATLSFDLVGFGDSQSEVSIRDVQLLQNPVIALNESATVNEDSSVNLNPLAADPISSGSTPVLQLVSNPAHGTLTQNADGTLTYTPDTHYFGTDSFQYSYTVNGTTSNVATVNIAVNEVAYPPTAANTSATVTAGKPYTFNPLAGATDINGNPMTAVLDTPPADGTLVVNSNGTWTYTPNSSYAGADQLVYHISDGVADSQPVTVSFTVQQSSQPPVAHNGAVQVQEDGSLVINFANFGTDADGNPLTGVITTQPAHGTLTQNADGTYTYTPDQYYYGSDSLNFTLTDGSLGSQQATLSITVNKVEIAPTLTSSSASLNEDGSATLNPLANATDVNGDPLTASIVTQPAHGTITVNTNGTWTYTPNQYFYGTDTFTYSVSDGTASSNIAAVTFTVNKVEIPPTLANSSATLNEGSSATLSLLASATDVNGDPVTAAIVTPPAHGTVTRNADGTWTYTPSQHFFGTDTFTYTVSDGQEASNVATVTLNVTQVIHAPVATNDSATTVSGTPVNIAVLANDTDVDGNPLTPVIVGGPSNGSLTVNPDGTITYTPNSGFVGTDQFTYEDQDANGVSNVATVTITVAAQGTLTVTGSTVSTNENTPYVFKWSDFDITEPNAPALYVDVEPLNGCSGGQLEVQGSDGCWNTVNSCVRLSEADVNAGKLRFVPGENETGFNGYGGTGLGNLAHDYASFTYSGYDGQVASDPVTMTVDVIPVATAPTLSISQQVTNVELDVVRTNWQSVANPDTNSTQVNQSTLEGWTAVGASGFTVWSDQDVTTAPDGTSFALNNGSYPGGNFLQLAGGTGISRTVNTIAGMQYSVIYDFASLPQTNTGSVTLYVDGQPEQVECPPTSQSDTSLDWHEAGVTFIGTGGAQTIQLMSGSAGAMLENVSVAEDPVNTGYQDTAIKLQDIEAALADNGGSEALSVTLQGLPPGAVLTDGTNSFTATADQSSVDITNWYTWNLSLTPPSGLYGSIPLTVTATALAPSNGSSASVTQSLPVTVLAAPVAQNSTVSTPENTPYVFQWSDFNVSDAQNTALSIDLSTWCQGGGYLEYLTSGGWETATDGLTVTKADIDAGKLRFVPYQNETGYSGYGGTGLGNLQGTYTLFDYAAFDGGTWSNPVEMNIDVVPVATAPELSISQQVTNVELDVVRTNWQSVANPDTNATLVNQSTLEGWTAVGASGFTVWSDGDVATAPDGTSYPLYNGSYPGANFLQLAGDTGISRTINTIAGMQYSVIYDFASLPQDSSGSITLYVDGQPVQVACPPTSQSGDSGLDWHEAGVTFIGTGGAQTIQLMSGSAGVMLENVSVAEDPVNTGYQDTAIKLQDVEAALADNGGSEALSVTLQGLPSGAVLTDGTNSFTATADQSSVDITNWATWNLSITPPSGFFGSIPLTVTATALVPSNGSSATVTQSLPVTVLAAPVAQNSTVSTPENTPYVFQWSDFNVSDAQNTALSIDLSTWCQGGGYLEYLTSGGWQTATDGLTVTKADIDAGKLRFVPYQNETGYSGYGGTGLGDRKSVV